MKGFCIDCVHVVPRGAGHAGDREPGCAEGANYELMDFVLGRERVRRSVCAFKNDHQKCTSFRPVSAFRSLLRRVLPTVYWRD